MPQNATIEVVEEAWEKVEEIEIEISKMMTLLMVTNLEMVKVEEEADAVEVESLARASFSTMDL